MRTIGIQKNQNHLHKVLVESFSTMKSKNNSYSLRAFARKLGVSPAALSEMMNGKRNITEKTAEKIFDKLNFSPVERNKFYKISRSKLSLKSEESKYLQVEMDQYHFISDWYYFAILSLSETETFQSNPLWVAERLNIRISEAKMAIERLERLHLLKRDINNNLKPTGNSFKTSSDISNAALRKSHLDNLNLAKQSIEYDSVDMRDISSMTMAIDLELIPEAKKMILEFRRKLTQFLESENKQEVYKLNIQLFPLSRKHGAK